jgi:uncharacterized protein (DUF924 family)
MLKDCTCIDSNALEIIHFWFGGDQQINYRTKWFPEGSTNQQQLIDLEITTKYNYLLIAALNHELDHWKKYRTSCLALIILLDQFSRHIYRHQKIPPKIVSDSEDLLKTEISLSIRNQTDLYALEIANYFHSFPEVIGNLPIAEYVFSLMPLRHNQSIDHLTFILSKLTDKETSSIKGNELLQRFRKQTTRRLQHLEDRERVSPSDLF